MNSKQTCQIWPDCDCPLERDCAAFSFTASPATGGPARASDQASPASRAIDPGEAVSDFRLHLATRLDPSAPLKARGEAIVTEMRAIVRRADDALWMIQRELEHREDLLQASRNTIVEMGFAAHDLARLIDDL